MASRLRLVLFGFLLWFAGSFSGCSSSSNECGDGVVDAGEQCDGGDLNGQTCLSLGYAGGGALSCNPSSCQYDISQCIDDGTGSCTPFLGGCGVFDDNCCPGLTCVLLFGCLPE